MHLRLHFELLTNRIHIQSKRMDSVCFPYTIQKNGFWWLNEQEISAFKILLYIDFLQFF